MMESGKQYKSHQYNIYRLKASSHEGNIWAMFLKLHVKFLARAGCNGDPIVTPLIFS